jgi:hypothetical protein
VQHCVQILLSICAIILLGNAPSFGQGTIVFANQGPSLDAPIFDAAGDKITGPSSFLADFFWSSDTGATMDQLIAAGFNQTFLPINVNGGSGYFNGGAKTLPVPGGRAILGQVRVWDSAFGATYTQARDDGGQFGFSNLFLVTPDTPPGAGTFLNGLTSFQLTTIPEPSALAMAIVNGTVLILRCRIYGRVRSREHQNRDGLTKAASGNGAIASCCHALSVERAVPDQRCSAKA